MKNRNNFFFPVLSLLVLFIAGCGKNDLQYFEEETPFLNVWFGEGSVVQDSLTHNFAYSIADRDSIVFNYRIAGFPVDQDRPFELEVVEGDADLIDLELGTYQVSAGQYEGRATFYVKRPGAAALPVFETRDPKLTLRVKSSSYFQESPKGLSTLDLVFKNAVTKPDNWDQATFPYQTLASYFGTYSDVKYSFIIQTTGLSNFSVYYTVSPTPPPLPDNTITSVHAAFLRSQCRIALAAYELEHGEPLLDENRNPVAF